MDTTNDSRVLGLIFDGACAHRETALTSLAHEVRFAVRILESLADTAFTGALTHQRVKFETLHEAMNSMNRAVGYSLAALEADTTIGNIENLSRGSKKFFDQGPPAKKARTNVTQLQPSTVPTPQAEGSSSTTASKQGTDNPGRKRQRERRQSPNDQ